MIVIFLAHNVGVAISLIEYSTDCSAPFIKKYGSTSGMGQVQNGHLYLRYRSNSQKTKQRSEKSLQTTSLCYSIAKSTLKTLLTFSEGQENQTCKFRFCSSSFFFFFSIRHNSKTIWFVKILNIPNGWSSTVDYSYWFLASSELQLASYGLKTVANTLHILLHTLLKFSRNNCVGVACMFRSHPYN